MTSNNRTNASPRGASRWLIGLLTVELEEAD